jgi:hypothetical protein
MTLCPPCSYPDCSLCNGRSPGNPRCATALAESLRRVDSLWTPYVEWRRGQPFAPDPRPTDAFEAGYVRGQEDLLAAWRRTARPVDPAGAQVVDTTPDPAPTLAAIEAVREAFRAGYEKGSAYWQTLRDENLRLQKVESSRDADMRDAAASAEMLQSQSQRLRLDLKEARLQRDTLASLVELLQSELAAARSGWPPSGAV